MQLTRWQRLGMRAYLFAVGARRRMTIGARVMLIDEAGVLLVRHGYVPGWHLPGGGVEPGEAAEAAAARELYEETGLAPTGPMALFGLYHHTGPVTVRDHIALYVCRGFERRRPFRAGFEITAAEWFAADALPGDVAESSARRIGEVFGGRAPAREW